MGFTTIGGEDLVKKGMVFSILSFFMIVPIVYLLLFFPQLETASRKTDMGIIVFDQMSFFEKNVDYDLEKILFISGKRSIVSLTNNVIINGTPVFNSNATLIELMENGSFNGVAEPLMDENNIAYWGFRMRNDALSIGFNLTLENLSVSIREIDSFNLSFDVSTIVNLTDILGNYGLKRDSIHEINISISNFEDPLYPLNTFGRIKRVLTLCNQSPISSRKINGTSSSGSVSGEIVVRLSSQSFTNISSRNSKILVTDNASTSPSNDFKGVVAELNDTGGVLVPYLVDAGNATNLVFDGEILYMDQNSMSIWDLNGLKNMIIFRCYYDMGEGPSFLARGEDKFSSSSYNLQSFVDLVELSSNGLTLKSGESVVDYKYFDSTSYSGKQVKGIDETWFRLDDANALRYGVFELLQ